MTTPIFTTKLYIPSPRSDLVPHPRLIEQLNAGLSRKLTLVSAPAGFGKSTLLSALIQQNNEGGRWKDKHHPAKVAWLSLDVGDNDLSHFWIKKIPERFLN